MRRVCFAQEERFQEARNLVKSCYDADPVWVKVVFSERGLRPWEAGCAWIPVGIPCNNEESVEWPEIQLHPFFEKKKRYWGLYDRDEVLAHEYVHAIRSPLASDQFEEFFAYFMSVQSEPSLLKRIRLFLGPIFESPREPFILIGGLLVMILGLFAQILLFDETPLWPFIALPMAISFFLFGKLSLRWCFWCRCKRHLEEAVGEKALAVMVRLSDEEVKLFGRLSPEKIVDFVEKRKETDFRWQLLFQAYFSS